MKKMSSAWKNTCKACGAIYRGTKGSDYCPNCRRERRLEGARKGGKISQQRQHKTKAEERAGQAQHQKVRLNAEVSVHPLTFGKGYQTGKVVWIHPEGRFAIVEFEIKPQQPRRGKEKTPVRLRECFLLAR